MASIETKIAPDIPQSGLKTFRPYGAKVDAAPTVLSAAAIGLRAATNFGDAFNAEEDQRVRRQAQEAATGVYEGGCLGPRRARLSV